MAKRPRKGQVVDVHFWDHAEDSDGPAECHVYGRLHETTRHAYVVDSWVCDDKDAHESATKRFVILKKVTTSIKILRAV